MCGIAGLFTSPSLSGFDINTIAQSMAQKLIHRGPDDSGTWTDYHLGISLAHRRLAILELTDSGHQPMSSECGRYIIVFNGEIYNHLQIRKKIQSLCLSQKTCWRSNSDTETLLAAISVWGLKKALKEFSGMFAFALWDKYEKSLYLCRDRLGEKPLYYGLHKGQFLFASELKALTAYPNFQAKIDRTALSLYLRRNFIPAPFSIYAGIFKLPPASLLKITKSNIIHQQLPEPVLYWSLEQTALSGQKNFFQGNENDAVLKLERLLKQSVSDQMIADVPLGAFLSGGIDSSTIVALMQAQSQTPIRTFTVGFKESDYDESKYAKEVAAHLGTEHTELYISANQALELLPQLGMLYDEPFADVSQIPTFLVSELARKNVSVCLSGDGGDELFGGYNRHINGPALWYKLSWIPINIRFGVSKFLTSIPPSHWDMLFGLITSFLPSSWRYNSFGDKIHKFSEMLLANSPDEVYERLVTQWKSCEKLITGFQIPFTIENNPCPSEISKLQERFMFIDTDTYLPDDILVKIDRAAMGVSLETRVPMLNHQIVEFAWSLPLDMKIKGNQGKWLLRKLLDRYVPQQLINRPKAGFSVPIDSWLRGPLRSWAERLLNDNMLIQQGFFDPSLIGVKWKEHLQGKRNWSYQLWGILMFQAWLNSSSTENIK